MVHAESWTDCLVKFSELLGIISREKGNCRSIAACKRTQQLPHIVAPAKLGVVACVLAVVCKRMQQLPTILGHLVHRGKDATLKSL